MLYQYQVTESDIPEQLGFYAIHGESNTICAGPCKSPRELAEVTAGKSMTTDEMEYYFQESSPGLSCRGDGGMFMNPRSGPMRNWGDLKNHDYYMKGFKAGESYAKWPINQKNPNPQ